MPSIATSSYLPALAEPHQRETVANDLQATLHELIDLALIGKQLHWAVVGPAFRPVHLHIDELVDSWHALAETVAERAVTLGHVPDGQARGVAAGSQLRPVAPGALEDHLVVRELAHRVAEVSEFTRERMDRLGAVDAVSQDVLIDVVRTLEEHQWMLRAQLSATA
jgi:starvation-inducible DNA-binding protein